MVSNFPLKFATYFYREECEELFFVTLRTQLTRVDRSEQVKTKMQSYLRES